MKYNTSLDTLAKGITIGVFILFSVIGQESIRALLVAKGDTATLLIHSGILFFLFATLSVAWIFAPQSYTLEHTELIIHRPIGTITIKLEDIKEARALSDKETRVAIRTFGVGGLFGYVGKFHLPTIGHATYYTTQQKNKILIITNTNKK